MYIFIYLQYEDNVTKIVNLLYILVVISCANIRNNKAAAKHPLEQYLVIPL